MIFRARWFPVISLVALLVLLSPGAAVADDGVSFLGDQDLTVTLTRDSPIVLKVKVINSSEVSQDIHLDLVELVNEDSAQIPAGVLPDSLPLTESYIASGGVTTFELGLSYVDGLRGSYTGQLVAYGDDGKLARLGFTLIVEEEPVVKGPAVAVLEPDFLEEVTLLGVNRCPSPLVRFGLSNIAPLTMSVGEALSGTGMVGSISGDNGVLGRVMRDGTTLRVEDVDRAGEYTGKIDLRPDDKEGGKVTLKVQIRDAVGWPLLVLVAGLLISTGLDRYVNVGRLHKRLQVGLAKLKERADYLQEEAKKALPDDWPFEGDVYRIYNADAQKGLLAQVAEEMLQTFRSLHSDEERKKWGPDGQEFKRLQGYVDALPGLYSLSRAVAAHYVTLKRQVLHSYPNIDPQKVPILEQVEAALRPRLITEASKLESAQEKLKAVSTFVADFLNLYQRITSLSQLAKEMEHKQRAKALLDALVSEAVTSVDWLVELNATAKRLELDIQAGQVRERGESWEFLVAQPEVAKAPLTVWPLQIVLPQLPDVRRLLGLLPVEALSEKTSEALDRELRQLDLIYDLISGCIVVVTGLSVLYLGKDGFGSVADYVGVLLWGTALQEGFKLARHLAPGLVGRLMR